jgi:hypothetical protein
MANRVQIVQVPRDASLPNANITGPEWTNVQQQVDARPVVSADWFSDINAAISSAGTGGTVRLSANTTYDTGGSGDPLLLTDAVTIEGADRFTSVINATGASAIRTATPTTQVQNAIVRNLTLDGGGVSPLGLDARFLSRCHFDLLRIRNFTEKAVWFGGQQATDIGGWSNTFWRSLVYAPAVGSGLHFEGQVGTGAATANNINVQACAIYTKDNNALSYAVNIVNGEGNQLIGNDMGYGGGTALVLGSTLAQNNSFIANRMENTARAVLCAGGRYNGFVRNVFHAATTASSHHLVELTAGSYRNAFLWNTTTQGGTIAPLYYEAGPGYMTHIITPDLGETTPHAIRFVNDFQSIQSRFTTDTTDRFTMTGGGVMAWGNGTAAPDVSLRRVEGDPNGSVSAGPGSLALSTNGTIYRKATGTGSSGWVALT